MEKEKMEKNNCVDEQKAGSGQKIIEVRSITLGDGVPKICIPVTAHDERELRTQIEKILEAPCDMVEWRADFFEDYRTPGWLPEMLGILRNALGEIPLLFTFRTKAEGGEREVTLEEYEQINLEAASTGIPDLLDLELNRGERFFCDIIRKLHASGTKVIGSFHDFDQTPGKEGIIEILCTMQKCGADITKAAVMPRKEEDVLVLLEASLEMKRYKSDRPFITMSMGSLGAVSRLAGSLTGSALTFATAGRASAPGQMEAELLARLLPSMIVEKSR